MTLAAVSLDDKYALDSGRVYLSGTQALVRLPMMQRQRDKAAGLDTRCFITGYRGSPLGGVDQALWSAKKFVERAGIHFQPGVNEDLAATSIWGSQQIGLFGDAKVDGAYAMWYAKGPGVDRSGDVLRHGNLAGTHKHGGVLLMAGDDHTCKSSTTAHQTEYAFMDSMIPVLAPAGVQEFLDLGIYGWALSRYSGCWIAMKCVADTVDTSASVTVDPMRVQVTLPTDFEMPPDGLNIRWPDAPLEQEHRLHKWKLYAALAFARANRFNRQVYGPTEPGKRRYGIVTTGKSYLDVRQALDDLGISEAVAAQVGLCIYKVGMVWPLEREGVRHFAEGLEEIVVVEEKRAVIENQLKEQLYNWRADVRPRVVGKFDENRQWILPSAGELTPAMIGRVLFERVPALREIESVRQRVAFILAKEKQLAGQQPDAARIPYFCSGCPHNTSTRVPEGSRALAGIGCHYMSQWMDRSTATFTQMGGEGTPWIGQAPFVTTEHVFANLGDGTYFHSGSLAVRAAVAAKVNITYKILFNDAVAMTGGQRHDGALTPMSISRQMWAEGAQAIVVVTDEPEKYPTSADWAPGVTIRHRDDLDDVQKGLRQVPGVSVMIYDQTCAAEKRRRRKRGTMPDPQRRVVVNQMVCEGCGDCSVQSNCLSVTPVETEFGRKRAIDQSSCNKDFSCAKGFCPSFVTVKGGSLKKRKATMGAGAAAAELAWPDLPSPAIPAIDEPWNIAITGIGGTGVVTIGALIGMAAHLEGKGCSVLDMTGLAQKGGAVVSHVRVARAPDDIHATRVAAGEARLVLGCDIVTTAHPDTLAKMRDGFTRAIVNSHETITGAFTKNTEYRLPGAAMQATIRRSAGDSGVEFLDAQALATDLLGDSIATNLFMLGFAWQRALVPVSEAALMRAIELNGAAIAMNKAAFLWGRRAAVDLKAVQRAARPPSMAAPIGWEGGPTARTLDEIVSLRREELAAYQDRAYADRYENLVRQVQAIEEDRVKGSTRLAETVARYYYKLLAIKDEFEVARLYTDGRFLKQLAEQFEGDYELEFNLAPPIIAERDLATGHLKKRSFGPWMMTAFRKLVAWRHLRGTWLDPFSRTAERRAERQLVADYETIVLEMIQRLNRENLALCVQIAAIPEDIRGYGHIKEAAMKKAKAKEAQLLEALRHPAPVKVAAE